MDEEYIDDTPLKAPLRLSEGDHVIVFKNPNLPKFSQRIYVRPGIQESLSISLLDSLRLGGLNLRVFPWANVYIDGEYKDTTPLANPLFLEKGKHIIRLENPSLSKIWEKQYVIKSGKILDLNIELKEK